MLDISAGAFEAAICLKAASTSNASKTLGSVDIPSMGIFPMCDHHALHVMQKNCTWTFSVTTPSKGIVSSCYDL